MAKHVKMSWQQVLKNVGGLVRQGGPLYPEPVWYEAAMAVPPPEDHLKRPMRPPQIVLPEDEHVQAFYKLFPNEKASLAQRASTSYHVPPARIFAHRILELADMRVDLADAYDIAADEYELRKSLTGPAGQELLRGISENMHIEGSDQDSEHVEDDHEGGESMTEEDDMTEGEWSPDRLTMLRHPDVFTPPCAKNTI